VVALNGFGPFAIRMATPPGTKQPTHYGVGQIGTIENARLIAAAPDLLDALKATIPAIDGYADRCDFTTGGAIRKMVLAAIAKAEGR
jgi:hypothetical protein